MTTGVPTAQASHDKAAGKADEEVRMFDPSRALEERMVAGQVFHPGRDMGPDQPLSMRCFLVDAHYPIAGVLEERHHVAPTGRIVPEFGLQRALHGDADIGLVDRSRVVSDRYARRRLGRVDAENIAGGAVQSDQAENERDAILVIIDRPLHEIDRNDIGGVENGTEPPPREG
jgi:hypothetical protein